MFTTEGMTKRQADAIVSLRATTEAKAEIEKMLADATKQQVAAMSRATKAKVPGPVIGEITGYTKGRVWQLVNNWDTHPELTERREEEAKAEARKKAAKKAAKTRAAKKSKPASRKASAEEVA